VGVTVEAGPPAVDAGLVVVGTGDAAVVVVGNAPVVDVMVGAGWLPDGAARVGNGDAVHSGGRVGIAEVGVEAAVATVSAGAWAGVGEAGGRVSK
jgi:hypothetical protein